MHALGHHPRRLERRRAHLPLQHLEALDRAPALARLRRRRARARRRGREPVLVAQGGEPAPQLGMHGEAQGGPREAERVQARAHDEGALGLEGGGQGVRGARGGREDVGDARLEDGEQVQEVVELGEVLGDEGLVERLAAGGGCCRRGERQLESEKGSQEEGEEGRRTARDVLAALPREPSDVEREGTHRREEERDRVAHVDVVDRLEERLVDRARHLAAQEQVVRRRKVRRAARVGGEERFAHLRGGARGQSSAVRREAGGGGRGLSAR